jgi:hypothetical protein
MEKIRLRNTLNEELYLDMPSDLSEITLAKALHFEVDRRIISALVTKKNKKDFLIQSCHLLSRFFDKDISEFMKFDVSDILLDINSAENVLLSLINIIDSLFEVNFKYVDGQDFSFTYKERQFNIPYIVKTLFTGDHVFSKINTYQAVNVLTQIDRIKEAEKSNSIKNRTENENSLFYSYLHILSVLTLTEDEIIERMSIEDRMDFFKDIDAKTCKHVYFFLFTIMASSLQEKI